MDIKLQIKVNGLPEEEANKLGKTIEIAIESISKADSRLDLRRMYQVILTMDFATEMAELSKKTLSGNSIKYTDEEYATAVAKVLIFPRDDDYENILVFNAGLAAGFLMYEGSENYNEELFHTALHYLHHELCHVHDNNKRLDGLAEWMLRHSYKGKDIFIFPLTEVCWGEYIANFISSSSATRNEINKFISSFSDAITRTKPVLDKAIYDYRFHADLNKLMAEFGRHGEFLVKSAAYVLGYLDGLDKSLEDLSKDAVHKLSNSYFERTWNSMQKALRNMRELYPENWKNIDVYNELASVIESYYSEMGFILSTTSDGNAYINIPFRPETTPPD